MQEKRCWSRLVIFCSCELDASNDMIKKIGDMHKEPIRAEKHARSCDCIVHKGIHGTKTKDFPITLKELLDTKIESCQQQLRRGCRLERKPTRVTRERVCYKTHLLEDEDSHLLGNCEEQGCTAYNTVGNCIEMENMRS